MRRRIVVVDYDPGWPLLFEELRARIWPALRDVAVSVEHVGSTSVPGLAAKPIIDMTVVVASQVDIALAAARLATVGYVPRGSLGIDGREAFDAPAGSPVHNLYACARGAVPLVNHLTLRDYLREHPEDARRYGALKKRLAARFPDDIDRYVHGKTDLIVAMLRDAGCPEAMLQTIRAQNQPAS